MVQARTTATIMARILAPVREVRVAPGDRVRAGQVLIVLDGRDLAAHARSASAAALAADQGVTAAASEQQGGRCRPRAGARDARTHCRPARQALGHGAGARRRHRRPARGRSARGRRRRPRASRGVRRGQRTRRQRGGGHDRVVRAHHGALRRRRRREDGRAWQHGGARHAADAPGGYARLPARRPRGRVADRTGRTPAPSCPSRSTQARAAPRRRSAARWRKSAARSMPTRARFWSRSRCPIPPGCARGRSVGRTSAARHGAP